MTKPAYTYKYLVEYVMCPNRQAGFQTYIAKFTNESHAKIFFKRLRKDGIKRAKIYEIDKKGEKIKELRPRA